MAEYPFIDSMGRVQGLEGVMLSVRETDQLRDLFLKERDEKIGLWRDPERPEIVVYPRESGSVRIVNEVNGDARYWSREAVGGVYTGWDEVTEDLWETATRYFNPHPGPKPWDDAEKGEVWALLWKDGGRPEAVIADGRGRFTTYDGYAISKNDPKIKSGSRVWPEGDDD